MCKSGESKQGEDTMKKMMLLAAACAMVAAPSALMADTVTSVNVVGYYTVDIPAGGLALVAPVLESMQAGTIVDIDGGKLPNGAQAYIWDRTIPGYLNLTKDTRGNWTGAGVTNVILRGQTVWIRPNAATNVLLTLMGEVPGVYNLAGTTTVANIAGTDAVGYAYPVDIRWTNTVLSADLPNGSALYVWDITTQLYRNFNKDTRGNWTGTGVGTLDIKAGQGFWVTTPSPLTWIETVPYDL
jgi:hypothetical protein